MNGLISVGSTRPEEPDPLDPEVIKRIRNIYMYRPVSKGGYKIPIPDVYMENHLDIVEGCI